MATATAKTKKKPSKPRDQLQRELQGVAVGASVQIDTGAQYRGVTFNRDAIDVEARTVELTFSSETEDVDRWYGIEKLDHSLAAVRLQRLLAGGALLFNHDFDQHLGVIEDVRIEQRRGKAMVRFGNSELASEKFRDVQDGVLLHVSFGYFPHEMVLQERRDDGPDVWLVTDWEPYEISLVTVPADISVGVGRAVGEKFEILLNEEEREMPDETVENETPAAPQSRGADTGQPSAVQIETAQSQARDDERKRIADINKAATRFANYVDGETVQRFISEGKTAEQLRLHVVDQLPEQASVGAGEQAGSLGLGERELKQYSVLKAIRAIMAAKEGNMGAMKDAAFEMECSREIQGRLDRDAKGFFVPLDVMIRSSLQNSLAMQRTMGISNGADLIPEHHMADMYIEALRPNSVAMQAGVTVLDGLTGNLSIPRELLTPTFHWIEDDAEPQESEGSNGSIKMSPKIIAGAVPLSRGFIKQSSPNAEMLVQNAMLRGSALAIDLGIFQGTGVEGQPLGVTNMTGINVQTVAAAGDPTWAETVGFETKVAADDALQGSLAYISTPTVRGNMKVRAKDAGSGRFVYEGNEANGHQVLTSSQLAAARILFGNWADIIVGMWGVVEINPDVSTKVASGGLVMRVFQDVDVGVGHAESFSMNG